MSSDLSLKVLRREKCSFSELEAFQVDPRARQMLFVLQKLEGKMRVVSNLLDPAVDGNLRNPTLLAIAGANKKWLIQNRDALTSALSAITVLLEEIMAVGYNTNPAIEEATSITEHLGTIFRTVLNHIAEINNQISKIEATVYPEDLLQHVADMRKIWQDMRFLLSNQLIEVWKYILREEARTTLLKQVGEAIHGVS